MTLATLLHCLYTMEMETVTQTGLVSHTKALQQTDLLACLPALPWLVLEYSLMPQFASSEGQKALKGGRH